MQRKKDEEEADIELRMQEQSELTLLSVEEHKENLQKTMQRMKDCKEDFTEFLKIKDADQQAAKRKAKHDKQLIAVREVDVRDLEEEIGELTEERDQLEKRMQRYAVYSQYMDTFVQATNVEARRVMSRFKTLVLAREHLRKLTHQGQEKIREARAHLDSLTKESSDVKMHLTSTTAQYQRQLDEAQQNLMHWERTWSSIQKTAAEQTIFFGKTRMACLNLYRNVCERSQIGRQNPVHPEDTDGQLAMIETFLTHWISALKL
ncbi:coiled-coil domain-containing protein 42 like-2-like [Anguilla anguilla]|uniref:coiled-coil domain-containing protein 42 like-2-like n=1 Tax=Anguilla anguilla TaxID=7936 RepID=UPI0015B10688|nr:coiled-coil domain-containing protein 42 like-2-like [Anguilla anguilla]